MEEVFKDIKGYEGMYQVSNLGRVKSLIRKWVVKEKILKIVPHIRKNKYGVYYNDGYLQVGLTDKNKKGHSYSIHQLIARAFIQNPNHYKEINHINGIKSDNIVENIEWCTHSGNISHAVKNKLMKFNYGKDHHNSKYVLQYDLNGKLIAEYVSITEASKKTNILHSAISAVCHNKGKTSGGFIWKFK